MLSRIADSLFWLGRYIERAEDTARILDVNYHMLLEESQKSYRLRWDASDRYGRRRAPLPRALYEEANAQTVFRISRIPAGQSQFDCAVHLQSTRKCTDDSRPHLSREMWEDINGLYHAVSVSIR